MAGLIDKVKEALNCKDVEISCWTDSMITLGWIRGEPHRWQTFVANRVSEIKRLVPNAQWNRVISVDNPADIVSRGIEPKKLINQTLWWNGPQWLKTDKMPITRTTPQPNEEVKLCHLSTTKTVTIDFWDRFSCWDRIIGCCHIATDLQANRKIITHCRVWK